MEAVSSRRSSSSSSSLEKGIQEIGLKDVPPDDSVDTGGDALVEVVEANPKNTTGTVARVRTAPSTLQDGIALESAPTSTSSPTPTQPNESSNSPNGSSTHTSEVLSVDQGGASRSSALLELSTLSTLLSKFPSQLNQYPISAQNPKPSPPEKEKAAAAVSHPAKMCLSPPPGNVRPTNDSVSETNQASDSSDGTSRSTKKKRASKGKAHSDDHSTGRWTDSEHQAFLRGLHMYGREWKKVASHIPTRTSAQVRSHAQKYFTKMQRDQDAILILSTAAQNNQADGRDQHGAAGLGQGQSPAEAASLIPGLTPSMRSTVTRILSNPESVEAEVEDTLQRLRERYNQLQERLIQTEQAEQQQQQQQQQGSPKVPSLVPVELPVAGKGRKRPAEQQAVVGSYESTTASVASSLNTNLEDEELIALSVLQGALPKSGGSIGSNSQNCDDNNVGEDNEDDEDTTVTNPSTDSNKRTKSTDSF